MDRPLNILYLFTDQQGAEAMSAAGNPYLETPAMDRLAAAGVRFRNAYCTYPLCVPSRMSMVTGRMPHELGIFANCRPSATSGGLPTLGRLFQDAGYRTHWVGKWHLTIPEENHREHGFAEVVFGGGYGDLDTRKADAAAAFLARRQERPFFLAVSFNNPHDCCELSRGDALKMGPIPAPPVADLLPPLPPNHAIPAGEPDQLRIFAREQSRIFRAMDWDGLQARRYLWGYYRLVEKVDREIGRVLDALEESGLADTTLIVFSSDHGDGAVRHRWNQKWSLYEESVKVPFIVAGSPVSRPGRTDDRLVSAGLDLLPTLCDYAGLTPPAGLEGRSVRDLMEGRDPADWRKYVAAETAFSNWSETGNACFPKARMVRGGRYKYTAYDAGERREQFVDLEQDPGEMVNLADSPAHQAELARHRAWLQEWLRKTNDVFTPPTPDA